MPSTRAKRKLSYNYKTIDLRNKDDTFANAIKARKFHIVTPSLDASRNDGLYHVLKVVEGDIQDYERMLYWIEQLRRTMTVRFGNTSSTNCCMIAGSFPWSTVRRICDWNTHTAAGRLSQFCNIVSRIFGFSVISLFICSHWRERTYYVQKRYLV